MKKYKIQVISVIVVLLPTIITFSLLNTKNDTNKILVDKVVWNLPFTFNYARSTTAGDLDNLNLLAATPLALNKNNEIVNYAAKDIKVSNNDKLLTITLKDGLKYQDGSEITAQDYVNEMKILADPKTKSGAANYVSDNIVGGKDYYDNKVSNISGLKVINKKTYTIELLNKSSYFKSLLTNPCFAPVSEKEYKKYSPDIFGTDYKQVLSSGEYYVSKYVKNQYIMYKLNTKTSLVTPNLPSELKFKEYSEKNVSYKDYKNGLINSLNKSEDADKYLGYAKNKIPTIDGNDTGMHYLVNNTLDKKTFEAMNKVLDKKYIINKFYYGLKKLNNSYMPQINSSANLSFGSSEKNDFDLEAAKKLNIKKQKIILQIRSNSSTSYNNLIKYAINQWNKIGIEVETKTVPFGPNDGVYASNDQKRNFDVTFLNFGLDYPSVLSAFTTFSSTQYWNDELYQKYNNLINQVKTQTNIDQQNKIYKQIVNILTQSGKISSLYQDQTKVYIQKNGWKNIAYGQLLKPIFWEKNSN